MTSAADSALFSQSWRHRAVRDLAWALFSPALMRGLEQQWHSLAPAWQPDVTGYQRWLQALDQEPAPLHDALQRSAASRLGLYYEDLLAFFFSHYPDYRLLTRNRAVTERGRTLGEFDFLVADQTTRQCLHIEVAVKFYLQLPRPLTDDPWSRWIGPACKDRLDVKLHKLLQKQCQLSQTDAGQASLQQLAVTDIDTQHPQQHLWLQGYLFTPLTETAPSLTAREDNTAPCPFRNTDSLRGFWCSLTHFQQVYGDAAPTHHGHWYLPDRLEWLALLPARQQELEPLTPAALTARLQQRWYDQPRYPAQPQLVLAMEQRDDHWHEIARGFITPDDWLEKAMAILST